jgi:hypothetical protein
VYDDTQHYDIQRNDTQYNNKMRPSIMALNTIMLSVLNKPIMLYVVYAESLKHARYVESRCGVIKALKI